MQPFRYFKKNLFIVHTANFASTTQTCVSYTLFPSPDFLCALDLYIAVCECMHVHITCIGAHHALRSYTHSTAHLMTSCDTHLVLSGHISLQLTEHSSFQCSESIRLANARMHMVMSSTTSSPADSFSPPHCDSAPLSFSPHWLVP